MPSRLGVVVELELAIDRPFPS